MTSNALINEYRIQTSCAAGRRLQATSAAAALKVSKSGVSTFCYQRSCLVEFSYQDLHTAFHMVNLQQSVLFLIIPTKNWVRPHHRSCIRMLGSEPITASDAHDKLHQWLTRVKPINSFVSQVLPEQHEGQAQHELSEVSALWLNVHSGDRQLKFQQNGLSSLN
jgi:hypothetical protein